MRIAVLYTGETRTIQKTLPYFQQAILRPNVDVFAVIQSNDREHTESLLPTLKSLQWFERDDVVWTTIRDRLLDTMNIDDGTKRYLRTSGSMIEYYQLHLAYQAMVREEGRSGISYDYILRCRTDVVFTKPFDFAWTELSKQELRDRIQCIQTHHGESSVSTKTLTSCMNSLPWFKRIYSDFCLNTCIPAEDLAFPTEDEDAFLAKLQDYIQNGRYVITLRENVAYAIKRDLATLFLPAIGVMYGMLKSPHDGVYWWNAESQFRAFCAQNKISIFDSCTSKEGSSLYAYDEATFFENSALKQVDDVLFFIMRR